MNYLDDLNPQQRAAVAAPLGPVLVLAGPGSGKTRVLTRRLVHLIVHHQAQADSILAVTFTNKAAHEMKSRVMELVGQSGGRAHLSTFHSFAAGLLRRYADQLTVNRDFVIFDSSDQRQVVKLAVDELNLDPKQVRPGRVQAAISSAKNELIGAQDYSADTYFGEIVRRIYGRYQEILLANNGLDFDDLLSYAVELLQANDEIRKQVRGQYAHILVDEFQDTNTAQYALLQLMSPPTPDIFAVGDADQSIYRWRGADYRNVQRFERDYPDAHVILLEQNYRSTQTILDAAMAVIDRVPNRTVKRLFTARGPGPRIHVHEAYDDSDEARFVVDTIAELTLAGEYEPGDCAIMYRTNAQSRALEEAFLRAGLPYRLVGAERFYGRREVKDIIAYLRLIHNPDDRISLERVINTPTRGIGAVTQESLYEQARKAGLSPGSLLLDLAGGQKSKYVPAFDSRALGALAPFGSALQRWRDLSHQAGLAELIERVLHEIEYRSHIDDGTEEGHQRWENVLELKSLAQEFSDIGLTPFLEHVALVSDQDTLTDDLNAPILLTLHSAKGLEFPVVFIIGLDEGMIPHQRSFNDPEEMAEERRLFYVGITRAKDRLYLLRTFRRRIYGDSGISQASRFLLDIPTELTAGDWAGAAPREQVSFRKELAWETQLEPVGQRYRAGMRVNHPSFGEGMVIESRVDQQDEEVVVAFEESGIKHLLASLANLEIQSESETG